MLNQSFLKSGIRTRQSRLRRLETLLLPFADVVAFLISVFSGHLSSWLPNNTFYASFAEWWTQTGENIVFLFCCLALFAIVRFAGIGHYSRRKPFWDEVNDVIHTVLLFAALDAIIMFLTKSQFSRLGFAISWLLAVLLIPLFRVTVKRLLLKAGGWRRPTVIIGAGEGVQEAIAALHSDPLMGFNVIAFITPEAEIGSERSPWMPPIIRPLTENLLSDLDEIGASQVVLTFEASEWLRQKHLVGRLYRYYPDVHLIPPSFDLPLFGAEISHFFRHEVLLLTVRNNLERPLPRLIKRSFDIAVAAILLTLLTPLFMTIAFRIRRTGASPIYSHERVGQWGVSFKCYKFRTMRTDGDSLLATLLSANPEARVEWERDRKLKNDPRITDVGHFLRRTSLDELPQLWNVLKGDMSLVGPRPITEEEIAFYGDKADYYLETRPGITGVWQISGRNDVTYHRRVYLDAWYAKNWSLWYDLVIILKTAHVVWAGSGAY